MPATFKGKDKVTPREKLFIAEYLVSLNAADAYRKAGYSPKGANVEAKKTLTKPHIAAEIVRRLDDRYKRLEIDADALLKRAETILTADPRELTGLHVGACRYCYGEDHNYQWKTKREWEAACLTAEQDGQPHPRSEGGFGYNITKRPKQDCPECNGLGSRYVWLADTRDLSPQAQILFEGVKQTKGGLGIVQASKAAAFKLLANHLGLMTQKHEIGGTDGKPVETSSTIRVIIVPAKVPAEISKRDLLSAGR
jgi:hypothetical protein